ncbi:MAG: efflux transporter outer membrane subunit [Phycisphaerae bacterium]|nr:efflux transporter outer membrane subunit [Phycisphaerae bacterium]
MKNFAIVISCIFFICGCAVGPNYKSPTMEMPQEWPAQSSESISFTSDPNVQGWWKMLEDGDLNNLIEQALENNRDIKAAIYRVEASRASLDFTSGRYFPNVDATADYTRTLPSSNGAIQFPTASQPVNIYSAGFDFLWEIDLFGKIKRSVESTKASYQASIEDYRDVMVTLLAEVCRNYIDLRTTQARIAYAIDNIEIQRKTFELTQSRYKAEIVSELDVRQAELNLANTESEVPTLRVSEAASLNRLAVLLGELPGSLKEEISDYKQPLSIKENITIGLPMDMLRMRPDIRRAERQLAAQTAQIGIAKADLYPSLQLSGVWQVQSRQFSGLGNINNKTYSFGPGFQWNLFDGNRIRNMIKIEEATTSELLVNWENTVLSAAENVENAIVSYTQELQRMDSLDNSVTASLRSVELVESLYKNGLTDFQNVLDTQRSLFVQQDKLASSRGVALQAFVRIYKGFGAGWQLSATETSSQKTEVDDK